MLKSAMPASLGFAIALIGAMVAGVALSQDLDEGLARWRAAGIHDYEYSYQRVCECHPDIPADTIVTVRDGTVVAVRYAREDYAADVELAADRVRWFRTIDDLFGLVESAESQNAVLRVTYDPRYGFPTAIYVDYLADVVGDELDLRVTRFTPAP